MSLTVTQRPNQNGNWVAAKNPVIYKMTRKDFTWTTLVDSSGNTSIQIATNVTASFVAGDTIWLQSDDGVYSAQGTVVSSAFGAATTVITTVPHTSDNSSGYINISSRRPNYYVSVGVFKSPEDELVTSVNYYPSSMGLLTVDISTALFSILDASIDSVVDGSIVQDSIASHAFYIKYIEYWTGSSNSTISDSGNISYAVFGARQIGHDAYYADYLNTAILSSFDSLQLALGEYYCFSFISAGSSTNYIKKSWYDKAGVLLFTNYIKSTNNTNAYSGTSVPSSVYTFMQKFAMSDQCYPEMNITFGSDIAWSANTVTLATGQASKGWSFPFVLPINGSVSFSASITLTGNSTNVDIYIVLIDKNGAAIHFATDIIITGSNGTYSGTKTVSNPYSSDTAFIAIAFANSSGADKTALINSVSCAPIPSISRIDFKGIKLFDNAFASLGSWVDVGSGTSWSGSTVHLIGTFVTSKYRSTAMKFVVGYSYIFTYSITVATSVNYVKIVSLNDSNILVETFANFSTTTTDTITITPTLAATKIAVIAQSDDAGGTENVTINSFTYDNIISYETSVIFNTISGYPIDCTKNALTLFWRNRLGGESSFTFNYNQDYIQKLQEPFINNWKTVYDNSVSLDQFNALNELFGVGQIYQTPLIELTTSIDKSEARIGQQVYIVDSSGNKTGVIVVGSENKTQTKRVKHNFVATLELPEILG